MPRRKSFVRTLTVGAVALVGVTGSAWFAMGDRQPAPVNTTTATAALQQSQTPALKPSYLVSVRAPTPEEQAQRDALAKAKPAQPVIDLTPRAEIEIAEVTPDTGPKARVLSDVNVRSGPSSSTATLTIASAGSELPVLGQQGSWTQVALPDGGNGWIASKFLAQ